MRVALERALVSTQFAAAKTKSDSLEPDDAREVAAAMGAIQGELRGAEFAAPETTKDARLPEPGGLSEAQAAFVELEAAVKEAQVSEAAARDATEATGKTPPATVNKRNQALRRLYELAAALGRFYAEQGERRPDD
jgi:hypothetical protein